jgi:hypothetical protein
VVFGDERRSAPVSVLADPRFELTAADYRSKAEVWQRAGTAQEAITDAVRQIQDLRADLDRVSALAKAHVDRRQERDPANKIPDEDAHRKLQKDIEAFKEKLLSAEKALWQPPEATRGIVAETDAQGKLGTAAWFLSSTMRPATATHVAYVDAAVEAVRTALEGLSGLLSKELSAIQTQADALGLRMQALPAPVRL